MAQEEARLRAVPVLAGPRNGARQLSVSPRTDGGHGRRVRDLGGAFAFASPLFWPACPWSSHEAASRVPRRRHWVPRRRDWVPRRRQTRGNDGRGGHRRDVSREAVPGARAFGQMPGPTGRATGRSTHAMRRDAAWWCCPDQSMRSEGQRVGAARSECSVKDRASPRARAACHAGCASMPLISRDGTRRGPCR